MLPWSHLAHLLPVSWQEQREHLAGLDSLCQSGAACAAVARKHSASLRFPSKHLDKCGVDAGYGRDR